MPRPISAAEETAATAEITRPVFLAKLDFASGIIRVCDVPFSLFYDDDGDMVDEEFKGVGDLGGISAIEETTEGKTNRVTLMLTGVKASMVSIALNEVWRWRRATIYKGFLDADDDWVDDPKVRFQGWMEAMPVKFGDDGAPATIELSIVSRMAKWEKAYDNPLWADADHQKKRPGDLAFQFMTEIAGGKEVFWGKTR